MITWFVRENSSNDEKRVMKWGNIDKFCMHSLSLTFTHIHVQCVHDEIKRWRQTERAYLCAEKCERGKEQIAIRGRDIDNDTTSTGAM